ncbi:MAG: glycerol-3-phosphate 1-O-acyltransferase PlsY [Pseudomonadota bacterium]
MEEKIIALLLGYLLGSIPFGVVLTKLAGTGDLRSIGSGNIGATNVLRTGRKDLAIATLLLDAVKGTVAVLIAAQFSRELAILAGLGAFVGHLHPVWLKFKGGKGVATFLGLVIALHWPSALVFIAAWLATAYFTRYSSAGALVASLAVPVSLMIFGLQDEAELFVALAILLWFRHAENIQRILSGTEGKIGQKAEPKA